jgi:hypothetical protein
MAEAGGGRLTRLPGAVPVLLWAGIVPKANSLLTGKFTGNFAVLCSTRHKKPAGAAPTFVAWPTLMS